MTLGVARNSAALVVFTDDRDLLVRPSLNKIIANTMKTLTRNMCIARFLAATMGIIPVALLAQPEIEIEFIGSFGSRGTGFAQSTGLTTRISRSSPVVIIKLSSRLPASRLS